MHRPLDGMPEGSKRGPPNGTSDGPHNCHGLSILSDFERLPGFPGSLKQLDEAFPEISDGDFHALTMAW